MLNLYFRKILLAKSGIFSSGWGILVLYPTDHMFDSFRYKGTGAGEVSASTARVSKKARIGLSAGECEGEGGAVNRSAATSSAPPGPSPGPPPAAVPSRYRSRLKAVCFCEPPSAFERHIVIFPL